MSFSLQNSRCQLATEETRKSESDSLWKKLSGLERRLTIVVLIMSLVSVGLIVAVILMTVLGYVSLGYSDLEFLNVCHRKECVQAAASLIESMNTSVNPCDDFYQFACGGWIQKHPIPADRTRYGTFDFLREELTYNVKKILEKPSESDEPESVKKVKNLYKACANETIIDELGIEPLENILLNATGMRWTISAENTTSEFDWMDSLANLRTQGFSYLISIYVYLDSKYSNRSIIYVDQTGLGLGRNYLLDPKKYSKHVHSYQRYMTEMAKRFGANNQTRLNQDISNLMAFETKLANITTPPEQRRNKTRMYNSMTIAELNNHTDGRLDWLKYFNTIFEGIETINETEEVIVVEPEYLKKLLALIDEQEDNRTLSNYIGWRVSKDMAWHTDRSMRNLIFDYIRNVTGLVMQEPRWKTCAEISNGLMGLAVGYPYIKEHFNEDSKAKANDMISRIRQAFYEILETNDWMDSETKEKAKEKAAAMKQFIGYPEYILNTTALDRHYEEIEMNETQHFQNMMKSGRVETERELEELRRKVDKSRWITAPGVVNAFYSPSMNSISFPAGILQPPFFGAGRLTAMNYGAIGAVIGHEISHGFDDKGRQTDKDGNLQEWWEPEVVDKYLERAECIKKQYAQYCPEELKHNDQCLNGNNTLGENIADIGGLKEAFKAYKNWVIQNGPEARLPGLEDLTPYQLFYLSFASVWCGSYRQASLESQVLYGSHSPGKYRVWGSVSNSEDFAEVFNCPPSSAMNKGKDRCSLW